MNKIEEAIKEADDLTQEAGVIVKGGKKYLQVKDRVSIFRKRFGLDYGINTEIIDNDERHIIIKATITNKDQHIVGSGYAEEFKGKGVNFASAIENGETSAIGRALSSLGLHGGEYASANEIEAVPRKEKALQQKQKQVDDKVQQPAEEPISIVKFINKITEELKDISTLTHLEAYRAKHRPKLSEFYKVDDTHKKTITTFSQMVNKTEIELKEREILG